MFFQILEETEAKSTSTGSKKRNRVAEEILNKKPGNYTWGSLDIDEFVQKITQEGITDAKVTKGSTGYIIHLVILMFIVAFVNMNCLVKFIDEIFHLFLSIYKSDFHMLVRMI